jgi:signal recognition particle subunit SRP54
VFDNLSERLQQVLKRLRGQARVNEEVLAATLREIRLALLEADVAVPVVKRFLDGVREKALGQDVQGSLSPGQQVVKVVRDELIRVLGGEGKHELVLGSAYPAPVMIVGLQGSGKTTTTAKIGRLLKARGKFPFLIPADIARPAAIAQLVKLAHDAGLGVYEHDGSASPVEVARRGMVQARQKGFDVVLLDTAGRLHIDEPLMAELQELKRELRPAEVLFVADSMTGQDAVRSAREFHEKLGLTGICLTKLDGDARGGAAISIAHVTGVPLKFVGTGEKSDALEPFHADRMVSRILGMGDVLTLIEKAEEAYDADEAIRLESKLRRNEFTLEDFRDQLGKIRKLGPLDQLLGLLPGGAALKNVKVDPKAVGRVEAIIGSMTPDERREPSILNGSRKKRIARGSGTSVQEINSLLKQFMQARKMMKSLGRTAGAGRGRGGIPLPFRARR